MANIMVEFIKENSQELIALESDNMRGKIIEDNIEVNISEEEEKLIKARQSV